MRRNRFWLGLVAATVLMGVVAALYPAVARAKSGGHVRCAAGLLRDAKSIVASYVVAHNPPVARPTLPAGG